MERAVIGVDILEGDPDSGHEMGGSAVEMNDVGVGHLLRADGKIQRLKGERFPAVQQLQNLQ